MKKLTILTCLIGITSTTIWADNSTNTQGFLYKISTGHVSDVVYNNKQTELLGISGNYIIGNAADILTNPLSPNTGFLTNFITHESRVINVQGSLGGSWLTAICGNIVAGGYYYGDTNVIHNFLYNIDNSTYTTNITFTNSYPWATNAYFKYTSENFAAADDSYVSNTVFPQWNGVEYSNSTYSSPSDIIVYNISSGSNTLVKYPTNWEYTQCYLVGVSSNIVVGSFHALSSSAYLVQGKSNAPSETNGSFYYNADTGVYTELPRINSFAPSVSAISGDVIFGSWNDNTNSQNTWVNLNGTNYTWTDLTFILNSHTNYFNFSISSNSYIQTNIPTLDYGLYSYQAAAFEGNFVAGGNYAYYNDWRSHWAFETNVLDSWSDGNAFIYDISKTVDHTNNPILIPITNSYAYANGISGDYVIGGYSPTPTTTSAPTRTLGAFTIPTKVYGSKPFSLSAPKSTSKGKFSFASDNPSIASISGNKVAIHAAGYATITATQQPSGVYAGTSIEAGLLVNKATQKITFSLPASQVFKMNRLIQLKGANSAKLPITYTSSDNSVLSISGTTATMNARGKVTITASQSGNGNYREAPSVVRTITIK